MYNKCPIILTPGQTGHYLAIESWCIPHIYLYCNSKLIQSSKTTNGGNETIDDLSKVLVLLNPDFTTAWNRRKQLLLINKQLDPFNELYLSRLILKRKPKSPESITYRQLIIEKCLMKQLSSDSLIELFKDELTIALEIASSYRCNYYSWTYRSWLFDQIISILPSKKEFFTQELDRIHNWIESNISDASGYSYLQQLRLKELKIHSQVTTSEVIEQEIQFTNSLLQIYPTQEALILHRKFCIKLAKLFLPQV